MPLTVAELQARIAYLEEAIDGRVRNQAVAERIGAPEAAKAYERELRFMRPLVELLRARLIRLQRYNAAD